MHNTNAKSHEANDLNSTYLWNHHLGHVRKERMKKLRANGILESFDFESFDTCKYFLRRMTKTLFIGQKLNGQLA